MSPERVVLITYRITLSGLTHSIHIYPGPPRGDDVSSRQPWLVQIQHFVPLYA